MDNEVLNWYLNLTAAERKVLLRAVRILVSSGMGDRATCLGIIYTARLSNGRLNQMLPRRAVVVAR